MFTRKSIIFAPMEGITDSVYRRAVYSLCSSWDFQFTEFLRLPTVGSLSVRKVHKFLGQNYSANNTPFQILTNIQAATESNFLAIKDSDVLWLDLNFGCPSKKVCAHGGGASLLENLSNIKEVVKVARRVFPRFLTAKIRLGMDSDKNFIEVLKILEGEGVNAITVHPRTKAQMYRGESSWGHISLAVDTVKIPVIGNGDIVNPADVKKMFTETKCHSVMVGRGALANPSLAFLVKNNMTRRDIVEKHRLDHLEVFLTLLMSSYDSDCLHTALIKMKQLTGYLFTNLPNETEVVRKLQRLKSVQSYMVTVKNYIKEQSSNNTGDKKP